MTPVQHLQLQQLLAELSRDKRVGKYGQVDIHHVRRLSEILMEKDALDVVVVP